MLSAVRSVGASRAARAALESAKRCYARSISSVMTGHAAVEDFKVANEPVYTYLKGSKERADLEAALAKYSSQCEEIPVVIGDEEIKTGNVRHQVIPYKHAQKIATFHLADSALIEKAIASAEAARADWERVPIKEKLDLFLRCADLFAGKYRMDLNAATMLGQAKTVVQAEIDSAAELIDFFRFNANFCKELLKYNPISEEPEVTLNSMRYRGIEGFWAAVTPFNFTAIGGNLASAPTLMGNVVLWKPSDTAMLSNYLIYKIMREAGFPPGVVNFVPSDGPVFGDTITKSPSLAGINFTGSVPTFRRLWRQVGEHLDVYKNFPRLIGECGGKNFHLVHPTADSESVATSTIRSAFEFSGQKCSACSRMYVPESLWPSIKENMLEIHKQIKLGPPTDYSSFLSAVIDDKAFARISGYVKHAKESPNLTIVAGGKCDDSVGYYIEPTIIQTTDPHEKIMKEEIFGPVLTVYVYPDADVDKMLTVVPETNTFGLTGAIYVQDKAWAEKALDALKMAAGNFYINDKSTGSVVGQQPFGGGRLSGTNDKAGGPHYMLRFASAQSVKETFVPLRDWKYKYMEE